MNEEETQKPSRRRLYILLGVLGLVCITAGAVQIDQWLLERQLVDVAESIVREYNESDPLADGEELQTLTKCKITASRKYLLFGEPTGKLDFSVSARIPQQQSGLIHTVSTGSPPGTPSLIGLEFVYIRRNGTWQLLESYYCDPW